MNISRAFKYTIIMVISLLMSIIVSCEEDVNNPVDETADLQHIEITILQNNTSTRIADAKIVIDDNPALTCYTSGPGGSTGGSCVFMLRKTWHNLTISKMTYRTLDTTLLVTSGMSVKYFSLFNY